jgi:hypothetical protein
LSDFLWRQQQHRWDRLFWKHPWHRQYQFIGPCYHAHHPRHYSCHYSCYYSCHDTLDHSRYFPGRFHELCACHYQFAT